MNAKILSLALLILVATGLRAQNAAPAGTNTLSHDELLRRAARAKAETRTPAAEANTAAAGTDWSATNTPKNVNASGEKAVQVAEAKPAAAPAAPSFPTMPSRPASLRPARPQIPAAPAANAVTTTAADTATPAPAVTAPKIADNTMTIRPPSTANTVKNPDEIIPLPGINWTAADLEQILTIYTEYVGRTVLRPPTLPALKVALKQVTPLTRLEVVQMIEAAVSLNGVVFINVGEKFVTVMPTAEAAKIPGIISTNSISDLPDIGTIMTRVVQLKYSKPSEMMGVLTPFSSGIGNAVTALDSSGMLVLRDNVANVKRMLEMIEKIDTVAQSEIISEVIPIKYAKAEEISSALSSVGGGGGGTVGTRTSSSTSSTSSSGFNRAGQPGYNQPGAIPGAATPTPTGGSTFSDRLNNIIRKASSSGDLTILGSTKIIADIRSNSLLVFASRQDMEMIKDIISKLDVVLAQVLIETVIMDVPIDSGWNLGLSGVQLTKSLGNGNTVTGSGVLNNGQLNITNVLSVPSGLTYFANIGPDVRATLNAAATSGRARIVQKPRILTSHAKEGHIFLGESRPIVSSTYYGGGFGGGPSSSYQQQQAGIDLTVTPFVNTEGLVVMEITQEISDFSGTTPIEGVGDVPNITQRSIRGEVAVNDGETVLLGGIVLDRKEGSKTGVPILMDIPLLGRLFSNNRESKGRSELVVLMSPTVLKTPELVAKQTILEKEKMPGIMEAEIESTKKEIKDIKKSREMKSEIKHEPAPKDLFKSSEPQAKAAPSVNFNRKTPFSAEDEALLLSEQPAPVSQ